MYSQDLPKGIYLHLSRIMKGFVAGVLFILQKALLRVHP